MAQHTEPLSASVARRLPAAGALSSPLTEEGAASLARDFAVMADPVRLRLLA